MRFLINVLFQNSRDYLHVTYLDFCWYEYLIYLKPMPMLSIRYSRNKRANASQDDLKEEGEARIRQLCVPLHLIVSRHKQ